MKDETSNVDVETIMMAIHMIARRVVDGAYLLDRGEERFSFGGKRICECRASNAAKNASVTRLGG